MLTGAGLVAALGPQLRLQRVVFDAQLRAVSSTMQTDHPAGGIEVNVHAGRDDVPADGTGLHPAFVVRENLAVSKSRFAAVSSFLALVFTITFPLGSCSVSGRPGTQH